MGTDRRLACRDTASRLGSGVAQRAGEQRRRRQARAACWIPLKVADGLGVEPTPPGYFGAECDVMREAYGGVLLPPAWAGHIPVLGRVLFVVDFAFSCWSSAVTPAASVAPIRWKIS